MSYGKFRGEKPTLTRQKAGPVGGRDPLDDSVSEGGEAYDWGADTRKLDKNRGKSTKSLRDMDLNDRETTRKSPSRKGTEAGRPPALSLRP